MALCITGLMSSCFVETSPGSSCKTDNFLDVPVSSSSISVLADKVVSKLDSS